MASDEFRKAVAGVKPLRHARRAELKRPSPAPEPRQRRLDDLAVLAESLSGPLEPEDAIDSGEELSYLREGMSRQELRRLRSGHWVVQDSLDLHGQTRFQAAESVAAFVRSCAARGLRCVRIIHGKGRGSRNREPVLKNRLRKWLPPREEVLAYCQAPDNDGGSGALLVLLREKR